VSVGQKQRYAYIPMEIYSVRSRIYAHKVLYQGAYNTHLLYRATADSFDAKERTEAIKEIQTRYETEKKTEEIEKLNREMRTQKVFLALVIALLALAGSLLFFQVRSKRLQSKIFNQRQKLERVSYEKELASPEQTALRAQRNR
jgi:cell division protein FtsL